MSRTRPSPSLIASWEHLQGALQLLADPRARAEGIPPDEVARMLGVSGEDLPRWINRLNEAGPEDADPGDYVDVELTKTLVRIHGGPDLPGPTRLTIREILALLTLMSQIELPGGTSRLDERVKALEQKLLSAVAEGVEEVARPLQERVRIQPEPAGTGEHLSVLEQAAREKRMVELEYYNSTKDHVWRRKVRPFLVIQHSGVWYTVADERFLLRVSNIRHVELTDEHFEIPAGFNPEDFRLDVMFVGEAGHEMHLRGPRKSWTLKTATPRAVRSWVIARRGVVVLDAPAEEREKLVKEAAELLERYRGSSSGASHSA